MNFPLDMFSGLYTCHDTNSFFYYYYCIYFLKTLLYTVFITTLFNGNFFFDLKKVALLALIVLF